MKTTIASILTACCAASVATPAASALLARSAPAVTGPVATPEDSASEDWSQFHGGPSHDNWRKTKFKLTNPKVVWHIKDAHGEPTLLGDDMYSGGKGLFHINPDTGEVLAHVGAAEPDATEVVYYSGSPAITETLVIARKAGEVEAWDRALSDVVWSWKPPVGGRNSYGFPGVLADGHFIFTHGSDLIALAVADGSVAWSFSFGTSVSMVPAASEGRVFVGTAGGELRAVEIATGQELWSYEGEAQFGHTSPVVTDGLVILGDRGIGGQRKGAVSAYDVETGKQKWETPFGATGFSTPGVTKGAVFAGFGKTVGFFSLKDGDRMSKPRVTCESNAFGSPTILGDYLVFGNLKSNLYVNDARKGKLVWQFRLPEGQVGDFIYARERLFVSTTVGLFALEQGKGRMKGNVLNWTGRID